MSKNVSAQELCDLLQNILDESGHDLIKALELACVRLIIAEHDVSFGIHRKIRKITAADVPQLDWYQEDQIS